MGTELREIGLVPENVEPKLLILLEHLAMKAKLVTDVGVAGVIWKALARRVPHSTWFKAPLDSLPASSSLTSCCKATFSTS